VDHEGDEWHWQFVLGRGVGGLEQHGGLCVFAGWGRGVGSIATSDRAEEILAGLAATMY
jgi:hypothetical protein